MITDLIIPQEKLAQIQNFVDAKKKAVMELVIKDTTSMMQAMEIGASLKGAINKLETMRKEAVAPLNQQVKEINNKIKFFVEPLEVFRAELNRKMIAYQEAENMRKEQERQEAERKRQEELARIEAERLAAETEMATAQRKLEQEKLDTKEAEIMQEKISAQQKELEELERRKIEQDIALAMIEPVKKTARTVSGAKATFKQTWTFEVLEPYAENFAKIPRDYLCVDERAVKNAIAAGVREIAGMRIYQKTYISQ